MSVRSFAHLLIVKKRICQTSFVSERILVRFRPSYTLLSCPWTSVLSCCSACFIRMDPESKLHSYENPKCYPELPIGHAQLPRQDQMYNSWTTAWWSTLQLRRALMCMIIWSWMSCYVWLTFCRNDEKGYCIDGGVMQTALNLSWDQKRDYVKARQALLARNEAIREKRRELVGKIEVRNRLFLFTLISIEAKCMSSKDSEKRN